MRGATTGPSGKGAGHSCGREGLISRVRKEGREGGEGGYRITHSMGFRMKPRRGGGRDGPVSVTQREQGSVNNTRFEEQTCINEAVKR